MNEKILLLVSVWLRKDDVEAFAAFESKVARIQAQHGGRIERAIRLKKAGEDADTPYEVHLVSFDSAEGLAAYRADPQMRALAEERARIIARTTIVEGRDVGLY